MLIPYIATILKCMNGYASFVLNIEGLKSTCSAARILILVYVAHGVETFQTIQYNIIMAAMMVYVSIADK